MRPQDDLNVCYGPYHKGRCWECRTIRTMPRREFMAWFADKWGEEFCSRDPSHLTGSYVHRVSCEAA